MMGRLRWCFFMVGAWLFGSFGCGSDEPDDRPRGEAGTSTASGTAGVPAGSGGTGLGGTAGASNAGGPGASGTSAGGTGGTPPAGTAGSDASSGDGGANVGAGGLAGEMQGGTSAGNSAGEGPGDAGEPGGGAPPSAVITDTVAIVPDDQGLVTPDDNGIGIHGNWFADNDCRTSPGDCTQEHVIGPTGSEVPFDTRPFPSTDGEVCMRGVSSFVEEDSEYASKWGVRLVLPLNEGPNGELRPYDAAARGIGAFGVEVELRGSSMVDSAIRIALLVEGVDDTHSREYYGVSSSSLFVAEFKRVKQGNGANPFSVFDASRVTAIEITLPTRLGFELPFDLCVTRILAIPATIYEPDLSAAPQPPAGTQLVPLPFAADGTVLPNAAAIEGAWFAENDCTTSPLDCTADQTPTPGEAFPIEANRACARGVVDPVGAASEYDTKWGAAIGLYLNRPEPTEPPAPYDAAAHRVVGFSYKLRTYNIEPIRTEAISVDIAEPHFYETTQSGVHALSFTSLLQGEWVTTRTPLDPAQLVALRFHVPSASGVVRNFDFCVEDLAVIVEDD